MGVPKFYRWTSERYPCLSEVISESQIPEFDNLYLDMNGIIHNCSHPNDDDITFRISEEEIFRNIFAYIENLYKLIRPQKVFFMAVDGVAPRAKMNQQRARRFMSARTAQEQTNKAVAKGQELPTEKRFDSNCITPGTYFMTKLHNELADWVEKKIRNDPLWQNRRIYLSGHNCPGEGEHKIMDFIRSEKAGSNYDPNTRHCMYGLDADLIMLGIVSHEPHFSLLREEVTFNRPRKYKKPQKTDSETKKFHLLHLSLLREYLSWEFATLKDKTSFEYDMERIVDDWILMGLLVGNDFLPHLPHVHIHEDALPLLYKTYKTVLPTLDGYINEGGILNLSRFEKFLKELANNDKSSFMDRLEDEAFLRSKRAPISGEDDDLVTFENSDDDDELVGGALEGEASDVEENGEDVERTDAAFQSSDEDEEEENELEKTNNPVDSESSENNEEENNQFDDEFSEALALTDFMAMDEKEFENNVEACWTKTINNSFKRFKKNYYSEKMKLKNISKSDLKAQVEGYVRAIQWNLHYYYHGCISWSWFYPHHYAPYISDLVDFADMKIEFGPSEPFRPFEQLLAVLPAASADCLPKPLQELMTEDSDASPIADFYPINFKTDLNGKKNDWEAVILIPFIDEERLLAAMKPKMIRLTKEELARNEHGPHLLFTTRDSNGAITVLRSEVDKDTFRIPISRVKWGLIPNVKMDIYFPGFPTMKHLKHNGMLKKLNVNVFGMPSRKESMLLEVKNIEETSDIIEIGSEFIGEEVCIDWPILKLGKVDSIWGDGRIVRKMGADEIIVKDMTKDDEDQWIATVNHLVENMRTRYAIQIEEKEKNTSTRFSIAWVRRFMGLVYETVLDSGNETMMRAVKQFAPPEHATPVLLPLVVKDLLLEESRRLADLPIRLAFPLRSVVFVTDPRSSMFGVPTMVEGYSEEKSDKMTVAIIGMVIELQTEKMKSIRSLLDSKSLRWMNAWDCSKQVQVNTGLFSRVTGSILMWNEPRKLVESGHQISSDNKLNIGLCLKYNKKNLEVADYTKRSNTIVKNRQQSIWTYSNLTVRLIANYKKQFPEIFKFLENVSDSNDVYYAEDVWENAQVRNKRFEELKEFLANLPCADAEQIPCETEYADRQIISEIEKVIEEKPQGRMKRSAVPPSTLFRPELYDGKTLVDASADFKLLDRVVVVGSGYPVQKIVPGTVVGISGDKVDVLFDREFVGGAKIRGSKKASCLKMPITALLNVTYGLERKFKTDKTKVKREMKKGKKETFKNVVVDEVEGAYVPWKPKSKKNQEIWKEAQKTKSNEKENAPVPNTAEELTDSLNQLLKIADKKNRASEVPKGKKVSLSELLGASPKVETTSKDQEAMKELMKKFHKSKDRQNHVEEARPQQKKEDATDRNMIKPQIVSRKNKNAQQNYQQPGNKLALHAPQAGRMPDALPIHPPLPPPPPPQFLLNPRKPRWEELLETKQHKEHFTDFKPSAISRGGFMNSNRGRGSARRFIQHHNFDNQPSASASNHPTEASSKSNKSKKKRQQRLGMQFQTN
ncbi:unnamed protein product [Caenorhabditis bovis]|uniref:5'-3' exoribonuclease 1 n=1 Tax=Caenorhabditis bovis TaxID=2654633 RepID=A0A8S1ELY5_9PELO|nr:unnamed protein product [Caenorhabditis bovis]